MQRKRRGWVYPADWMPNTNFSRIFKVIFSQHIGSSSTIQNTTFHFLLSLYCSKYIIRIHQKPHNQLSWPHLNNSTPNFCKRLRNHTIICTKYLGKLNYVQKLNGCLHHIIFSMTYKNGHKKITKNSPRPFLKFVCVIKACFRTYTENIEKYPNFAQKWPKFRLKYFWWVVARLDA